MPTIQQQFLTYLIMLAGGYLVVWFWVKRFSPENKYPRAMMALKLAVTLALAAAGRIWRLTREYQLAGTISVPITSLFSNDAGESEQW